MISSVTAHSFYTNEDSILFTLIKQYEVEVFLASENLITPKVVAVEHSQNAAALLKQIVSLKNDTSMTTKINGFENAFSNANLSTRALVAADLADESLKQYGLAKMS